MTEADVGIRGFRIIAIGVLTLAIYVGSYALNSRLGGYWLELERDGRHKWGFGLSMPVAVHWQPALGYQAQFKSDAIGVLYAPLIAADRKWFHPTKYIMEDGTFEWFANEARISDIHPKWREEWVKSKASEKFE